MTELIAAAPVPPLSAHPLLTFLLQVGLLLGAALLLGGLARRLGMPAIAGELTVGIILGPSLLSGFFPRMGDWLSVDQVHLIDAVGQFGVLLLVAITGMHLDSSLVRRHGTTALTVSAAGLLLPLGLGVGAGVLLADRLREPGSEPLVFALFLGVAMCVSAIPVIAKTLIDMNLMHRKIGQLIMVSGTIDDAFGWLMLSVVSAMATTGLSGGNVAEAVITPLAVFLAAPLVGRLVVRPVMGRAHRSGYEAAPVGTTVVLVLFSAAGTHALGLEAILGAFLVGSLIGSAPGGRPGWSLPLESVTLHVFAPLFFATAGLRMDLTALADPEILAIALGIVVVAIVGKFLGAAIGGLSSGLTRWESLALGAGMNARGVVEVIIAMVGMRLGILSVEAYTIIVLVAVVTSLMAPPLLRFAMRHTVEDSPEDLARSRPVGQRAEPVGTAADVGGGPGPKL
ncbi:cation:proton antiporter [Streptomyces millisiae]|uniref:Cation:proton antiporter n=1 Tax=Streptomyces millisiae TaxID=3075542 RepID=A0ABU2LJM2_9ACTN|nr:cation:proton antiporter [Streptomyces sp. DSM 44918]MDT0317323.1 cation:proton antiporter [Streptomyces sp. DSM 44918]